MSSGDHVIENATYEDYLDSQLDHSDLFYLEVGCQAGRLYRKNLIGNNLESKSECNGNQVPFFLQG